MVKTGGTLSTKLIKLIGQLDEEATKKNVESAVRNISRDIAKDEKKKIRLYVELFARANDMKSDISRINREIKGNSNIQNVKLGVELGDMTVGDINKQIKEIGDKFKDAKTSNKLQLDIEFDFKGSASVVKKEMKEIQDIMKTFGRTAKETEGSVKKSANDIVGTIKNLNSNTKDVETGIGEKIKKEMVDATGATGEFSVNYKRNVQGTIIGADASIKSANGTIEKFKYALNDAGDMLGQQSRSTKIAGDATERYEKQIYNVSQAQAQLNRELEKAPEGFAGESMVEAQRNLDKATGSLNKNKEATDEVIKRLSTFKTQLNDVKDEISFRNGIVETQKLADEFKKLGGSTEEVKKLQAEIDKMSKDGSGDFKALSNSIKQQTEDLRLLNAEMSKASKEKLGKAIEQGDINTLKTYIGEMVEGNVQSLRMTDAKNKERGAIKRLTANMEEQNGVIKTYTMEYDKADNSIRKTKESSKELGDVNKGLGGTFAGIVKRITQYFGAMQLVQKSIQSIKSVVREVMAVDEAMTKLKRVADPSLSIEGLLSRSIVLSKELGASVTDVVGVVGNMARTFGDFNEEQLLAITRTATLMKNVSDLSLEESSSTIVGTMKAFNIEAEDTIHIVDAMNEVDKNFAISTDQIANAMDRAGATAQTFGVDLEHLIGDVTAIGEVTQESGERIGTALRTIYSRITTHDKAVSSIQDLGIAMQEMGDSGVQMRDASDIMGDLGKRWSTLSSEQKQFTALNIAGRHRMTQFLALMNNYDTAINATTTAYTSQGSAMREQEVYMQSYEYQMTVMKATASELALTIEDEFVGDAIYGVIKASVFLMDSLDSMIQKFGFLPTVLTLATGSVLLFSETVMTQAVMSVSTLAGKMAGMGGPFGSALGWISRTTGAMTTFGNVITGGLVLGGVFALAKGIEFLVKKFAEQKRATEEAQRAMESAIDIYNQHGNDISGLVDRYDELHKKMESGTELNLDEEREYADLVNKISTAIPSAVSNIDNKGQAHLRSTESIRKEVEMMDKLVEANARAVASTSDEKFQERADNYESAVKRNEKATRNLDVAYQQIHQTYEEYYESALRASNVHGSNISVMTEEQWELRNLSNATKSYTENSSKMNASTFEMHQIVQEQALAFGDSTVAILTADGAMENTSTTAEALIRNYSSLNTEIMDGVRTAEEYGEKSDEMAERSMAFGEMVTGMYNDISDGMSSVDASRAIEQFDMLVNALPEDTFKKPLNEIQNDFEAMKGIISQVTSGAEVDVKLMVDQLIAFGVESNQAKQMILNLNDAIENTSLRAQASSDELEVLNDEIVRTQTEAVKAINPLEELFGFDSGTYSELAKYVEVLDVMEVLHGDAFGEIGKGGEQIQEMADLFGISEGAIKSNYDELKRIIAGLDEMSIQTDENGHKYVEYAEGMSESTKIILDEILLGNKTVNEVITERYGLVKLSGEEVQESIRNTKEELDEFFKGPANDDNIAPLVNNIREELAKVRGGVAYTGDGVEDLKLIMADGTTNPYLDMLQKQFEDTGYAVEVLENENGKMQLSLRNEATDTIIPLLEINKTIMNGSVAIEEQTKALKGLKDESISDEERETFVEVLENQMKAFGQEIELTGEKGEDLKLQFKDGTTSEWLDNLNKMVEELGLEIELVDDDAEGLKITLKDDEGKTIFETEQEKVKNLGKEIDATDEKIKGLTEKPSVVEIDAETTGFDGKSEMIEDTLDEINRKHTAELDVDTTKPMKELPYVTSLVDDFVKQENPMILKSDFSAVEEDVTNVTKSIKEIQEEEIKLELSEVEGYNEALKKITDTKIEIVRVEDKLQKIQEYLLVTNDNMNALMTNVENITHARNAIENLSEEVDIAIQKMGELYGMFSDETLDTSSVENASRTISEEVEGMGNALQKIETYASGVNEALKGMESDFNVKPINDYRNTALLSAESINQGISKLAGSIHIQITRISNSYRMGNSSLKNVEVVSTGVLGKIASIHRTTGRLIETYSTNASKKMISNYNNGLIGILRITTTFKDSMTTHMREFKVSMISSMSTTASDMRNEFLRGTNEIEIIGRGLPSRIGSGIISNMNSATGAMSTLARNMVRRFKQELGIHSPSRVFTGLGGDIIDGLVNGLSGSDITNLGQSVFSDFSRGAISTINEIKGYMTFEPVDASSFGSGFVRTSGFGRRSSPGGIGSTNHKGVDYGAPTGTPIPSQSSGTVTSSGYHSTMGNYIKIKSGDGKEHIYMHNSVNRVGVGDVVGRGQTIGNVGSTGNSTGPHVHYEVRVNGVPIDPEKRFRGFANGGFIESKELAWHGEEGPEAIIPLVEPRRERGIDLWSQTGERLGMNSELISLITSMRGEAPTVGPTGNFMNLDISGMERSGGGDTSTSGNNVSMFSSLGKGGRVASKIKGSSSSSSSRSSSSSSRKTETIKRETKAKKEYNKEVKKELDALYEIDLYMRKIEFNESVLKRMNVEIGLLAKNTHKYREALKDVSSQELKLMNSVQRRLTKTRKDQSKISAQLGKLSRNKAKHTEKERKSYNDLNKEFEENIKSIVDMEDKIRSLQISIDERKLQRYIDYLDEISNKHVYSAGSMNRTMAQSEFFLKKSELLEIENVNKQLKIKNDIIQKSIDLEKMLEKQQTRLRSEYRKAMKEYGSRSKEALEARERMIKIEDEYRKSVIDRIEKEKELEKIRRDILATQHEYSVGSMGRTMALSEFRLKQVELLQSENINEQLKYKNQIIEKSIDLERTLGIQQNLMKSEYEEAMRIHGSRSEQALEARKNLLKLEDDYRKSVIDRIEREQEIEKIRKDVAGNSINAIKNYYQQAHSMTEKAIDLERKALDKSHKEKMDRYDSEISKIESVYNAKIKELDDTKAENDYAKEISELNKRRSELNADISRASRDTSLEGRKRVSELQKELQEVNEEVSKTQEQRRDDLYRQAIEKQKKEQLEMIESERESVEKSYEIRIEGLEKQIEESKKHMDSIVNDDKFWHDIMNNFAEGNTEQLDKMVEEMENKMYQFLSGNFGDVSEGFKDLSAEDRKAFDDEVLVEISNSILKFSDDIKSYVSASESIVRSMNSGADMSGYRNQTMSEVYSNKRNLMSVRGDSIVDVDKIVKNIQGMIPRIDVNTPNLQGSYSDNSSGDTFVVDNLNLNMKDFKGSGDDVKRIFDNMAKELKKKGRR